MINVTANLSKHGDWPLTLNAREFGASTHFVKIRLLTGAAASKVTTKVAGK